MNPIDGYLQTYKIYVYVHTYMDQAYLLVLLLYELNLDLDPDKVCSIYCYAASKQKN